MTSAEVVSIITGANEIGDNVFNFFPKYKPYENLLTTKGGSLQLIDGNEIINRDDLISYINDPENKKYYRKKHLIPILDEINFKKEWKEISTIITSTQAYYDCERYYLTGAESVSESVYSLLDLENGEKVYVAADQTNMIVKYDYNQQGFIYNPKTGEYEEDQYVNHGTDHRNTEKHRIQYYYRD